MNPGQGMEVITAQPATEWLPRRGVDLQDEHGNVVGWGLAAGELADGLEQGRGQLLGRAVPSGAEHVESRGTPNISPEGLVASGTPSVNSARTWPGTSTAVRSRRAPWSTGCRVAGRSLPAS